ncbi:MAG: hypothetical protein SO157_06860 [Bullifex sp.]|nr:hypothetical protein [Spirochaetales bacterium]MDY4799045.1 hypothetical protein [Bullifex sp.]MDY5909005.1 hypothetical protein [Bullifex sp.]
MKRLFWADLLIALLLISCATTGMAVTEDAISAKQTMDETLTALQRAYEEAPLDRSVSYNWAFALASLNEYEKSLQVITPALEANPDAVRFYTLKAYCEKMLGRLREYERTYEALLELDEAYTAISLELMHHYEAMFEHEKAAEKARLVLKYEKDNEEALEVLGKTDSFYSLFRSDEKAITEYRKRNEPPVFPPISELSGLELLPLTDS